MAGAEPHAASIARGIDGRLRHRCLDEGEGGGGGADARQGGEDDHKTECRVLQRRGRARARFDQVLFTSEFPPNRIQLKNTISFPTPRPRGTPVLRRRKAKRRVFLWQQLQRRRRRRRRRRRLSIPIMRTSTMQGAAATPPRTRRSILAPPAPPSQNPKGGFEFAQVLMLLKEIESEIFPVVPHRRGVAAPAHARFARTGLGWYAKQSQYRNGCTNNKHGSSGGNGGGGGDDDDDDINRLCQQYLQDKSNLSYR